MPNRRRCACWVHGAPPWRRHVKMDATRTEKSDSKTRRSSLGLGVSCGAKKCWCPLSENMTLLDSMDYLLFRVLSYIINLSVYPIFVYPKILFLQKNHSNIKHPYPYVVSVSLGLSTYICAFLSSFEADILRNPS